MPELTSWARRSALMEQGDTTKQDGAGYRYGFVDPKRFQRSKLFRLLNGSGQRVKRGGADDFVFSLH